jgi:small subunit ribosomal protein S17
MSETADNNRNSRKIRKGVVVSKSGIKSVVVQSERREQHPVYGKTVRAFKKYHAHDEADTAKVGDAVTIMETRPLSATKRWRIVKPEEK